MAARRSKPPLSLVDGPVNTDTSDSRGADQAPAPAAKKRSRTKPEVTPVDGPAGPTGFGFDPAESEHHFVVAIPHLGREPVYINEQFVWHKHEERRHLSLALGNAESKMRVVLPLEKWQAIAAEVAAEFNARLKKQGRKPGTWKAGYTEVTRLFGKELVLLAWAIEDADPALIPAAIRNWKGLTPEERWWLFTMTNAATGHAVTGRNLGWRKAVRYALTEGPVPEGGAATTPTPFRLELPHGPAPGPTSTEKPPRSRRK